MNEVNDILEFLKEEGYRPKPESDGEYSFKSEGTQLFLSINTDPILYVTMTTYWRLEDVDNPLARANEVNQGLKAAKVFISENIAVIGIEQHCTVDSFKVSFARNLLILNAAQDRFFAEPSLMD